uniref:hypothetical protein n=1 Tax=Comamonas testosteroni TaxID=285 RepID=UPI0015FD7469|nr:hypothetical protein [Comamonas testosteroni]
MASAHDQNNLSPYRKVSTVTWSDRKVLNLTPLQPSGQALFLMLMVGPQTTNIPGVQPVGRMAFAEMLGWELDSFDQAFAEALREGLAKADWKARLIFVPKAIKHNLPQSPNVVKGWAKMWSRVPECDLKTEIWHTLKRELLSLGESFVAAFKSACPLSFSEKQEGTQEDAGKPSQKPSGKATGNQEAVNSKQELDKDSIESLSTSSPGRGGGQQSLEGVPAADPPAKPKTVVPPCPYGLLLDAYEELCPTLPKVRRSLFETGKRADAMRSRWAWVMTANAEVGENAGNRMATTTAEGIAWFRQFFEYVAQSPFLLGQVGDRNWQADIGWLMKRENFEKVLEGKYHSDMQEAAHA